MTPFRCAELVELFQDESADIRTTSLTLLCESYANDERILRGIFKAWDRFGVDKAFIDFPMLSYLPASSQLIEEACERAVRMAEGRALTDPITRAAGKLIEQLLQLPANELEPHLGLLRQTLGKSKIFFRVDLNLQIKRIDLLNRTADQLAQRLDAALSDHCSSQNPESLTDAVLSLEALRRQYPNYLELSAVLRYSPAEGGSAWASFCATLQSLIQFSQPGLEPHIGQHLVDHREYVFSQAVEALARSGSEAAGVALIEQLEAANVRARQWIARGLQRIRQPGLAARIAHIRTDDSQLRNALFVAQLRQVDSSNTELTAQLRDSPPPSASWLNLLRLNQRLWPGDAQDVHAELERILRKSAEAAAKVLSTDKVAAQQKREAIRDAIREQIRKAK
jgi:HEAT repeat protein